MDAALAAHSSTDEKESPAPYSSSISRMFSKPASSSTGMPIAM